MSRIAVRASGRTWTPLVAAVEVKECPAPTAFAVRPSAAALRTSAPSSPTEAGATVRAGAAVTLPAQLRHTFPAVPLAVPAGPSVRVAHVLAIPVRLLPLRRRPQPAVPQDRHRHGDDR